MSEQQSGAGYPQQPTSGQPQQQAYSAPQYASPQAQYQAQQQYAGYAQPGPSLFDKLGVPAMPAILGLSGLAALVLAGLIAGTSDSTSLGDFVGWQFDGVQTTLTAVIVMFALTLFGGERLRGLWKALTIAASAVFVAKTLFALLSLGDGSSASDASAWIGLLLLVAAYGLLVFGAIIAPTTAQDAEAKAAAKQQQAAQQAQQQAAQQQQQQAGGYGQQPTQQNQWPQNPQQ